MPAKVLMAWIHGEFELVVSPLLLAELKRALGYPKLRRRIPEDESLRVVEWLAGPAVLEVDPKGPPPLRSPDPGDDYLIGLAASQAAVLVSGDRHLLGLGTELPIYSPQDFLALLRAEAR